MVKPNVSVLLMWKCPLTATASMTQPATFSPTTVSSIAPARPHSCGVEPIADPGQPGTRISHRATFLPGTSHQTRSYCNLLATTNSR